MYNWFGSNIIGYYQIKVLRFFIYNVSHCIFDGSLWSRHILTKASVVSTFELTRHLLIGST
jgi:hypothetical protein